MFYVKRFIISIYIIQAGIFTSCFTLLLLLVIKLIRQPWIWKITMKLWTVWYTMTETLFNKELWQAIHYPFIVTSDKAKIQHTVCSEASPTLSYSRMALYRVLSRWDARTTFRVSGGTSATPVLNTLCRTLSWASRGANLFTTIASVIVVSVSTNKSNWTAGKNQHNTYANNAISLTCGIA